MPKKSLAIQTIKSIEAKCEIENNCWIWQGYTANKSPYISHEGKMQSVRKLIYIWSGKTIQPQYKYFASRCRNPLCVSPMHVAARTQKMQSSIMAKSVQHNAKSRIMKLQKLARSRPNVKLDEQKARAICNDERSCLAISIDYGVSKSLISKVKRGQGWKDLSAASNPWQGLL